MKKVFELKGTYYRDCRKSTENESTKVQNPRRKDMLLISEQTDSHMLCYFAGGVSTLSLELSRVKQLAKLASYI